MKLFFRSFLIVLLSVASAPSLFAEKPTAKQIEFFEAKIRPVLVKKCYRCHSAEAQEKKRLRGKLRLDIKEGMLKGGESGPTVVPSNPKESLLIKVLRSKDADVSMPPSGRLPESVIKDFERWIADGAADPREGKAIETSSIDWGKAKKHWAFQPIVKPSIPNVKDKFWPSSPVDHFVLAQMEARGLKPVADSTRRKLIRRATFDLIGLPPTPNEIQDFLDDRSPDAFAKVVDRLLASPHYGERWGRHWLDVARYAEDQAHTFGVRKKSSAFQYRDWVIHALNKDMAYDRFVKLQVAGDLMKDSESSRFEQIAGLGFFGLGAEYYKNSDRERALADELDDRIDTMTRGFMALTVSCARCHDHKFDPIPTQDYYSLAGVFYGSRLSDASLATKEELDRYNVGQKRVRDLTNQTRKWVEEQGRIISRREAHNLTKYLTLTWAILDMQKKKVKHSRSGLAKANQLEDVLLEKWVRYLNDRNLKNVARFTPSLSKWKELGTKEEVGTFANDLQQKLVEALKIVETKGKTTQEQKLLIRRLLQDRRAPFFLSDRESERVLTASQKQTLTQRRIELNEARKSAPPKPPVTHVISGGGRDLPIYMRGDPARKGKPAPRRFLRILAGEGQAVQGKDFDRLDLADHIVSSDNPLTARVIVNRVWQKHFGRGIVASASNFGKLGEKPTHPQLLDWLTSRFVKSGWSIKKLHRQIMLSRVYQLSSDSNEKCTAIDPENVWLWRLNRRRLDVELWRDSLLSVAGTLDNQMGGPTFPLSNRNIRRRTVYARVSRHLLDSLLRLFDFPDANVTNAKRSETTVPQQQLFMLNSDFMVEQAKAFGERIQRLAQTPEQRVKLAHRLAFGREPTSVELTLSIEFLDEVENKREREDKVSPWTQYAQALFSTNEFLYVD